MLFGRKEEEEENILGSPNNSFASFEQQEMIGSWAMMRPIMRPIDARPAHPTAAAAAIELF